MCWRRDDNRQEDVRRLRHLLQREDFRADLRQPLYVKPTEAGRALLSTVVLRPPYDGAKDYFWIEDVDDHQLISNLVKATCKELK